jgi:transcriptional regulator with XRE-family HTH domain
MMTNGIEHLEKIRKLKGFSQQYMAGQLNISQNAYSKIERREKKKIDAKTLTEICEVLEIEIEALQNFDPFRGIEQLENINLTPTLISRILTSLEKVTILYESIILEKDARIKDLEYTISLLKKK